SDPEGPGARISRTQITGGRPEELLIPSKTSRLPWASDWTSGGIVYEREDGTIWMHPSSGPGKSIPLVEQRAPRNNARVFPDGKWIAYAANESGRFEIVVQSVSNADVKYGISTEGGSVPRWRRDGEELFYLAPDGKLMAVSIDADKTGLRPGIPRALFQTALNTLPEPIRPFGVHPDGERFLIATVDDPGSAPSIVVASNWQAAIR